MELKDIKTLITSGTIILAVGLYLVFSEPKQETEQTDSPAITEQNSAYNITPEMVMDKTGKQLVDVKFLNANDGDTFNVEIDGKTERVRLLMIDTPEMNYNKGEPMPYAEEAKARTTALLEKADSVQLLFDKGPETDNYDRLLAYAFVDNISLHEVLLSEGLAAVRYVNKPNDTLEKELLEIQQQAEQKKLNIWAHDNYLQHDGFHPEEVSK
ncbi:MULTISPECIES: thermonuclease family protein [Solibacillus]|uniref:Thermonuclease family protein n=1 Tax=Solibacillus merdavium TaxID=2762218 RepID=A0ABR8XHX6_9BACL|nr:thermonuclease family protein [Solibacillus merdavium]MBD8031539.1 thermonuclease family protein [Solibacillus merdavium]